MRLTELSPRWLSPDVLAFVCPACASHVGTRARVTVKRAPMSIREQLALFASELGEDAQYCHPTTASVKWSFSGTDFATLTVEPSLNIVGHWHGTIVNGAVTTLGS